MRFLFSSEPASRLLASMWSVLASLGRRIGGRLLLAVFAVVLALVGSALWMTASHAVELETARLEESGRLRQEIAAVRTSIRDAQAQLKSTLAEVREQERRLALATKVLENLRSLLGWWERVWKSDAELRRIEENAARAEKTRDAAQEAARIARELHDAASRDYMAALAALETKEARLAVLDSSADPFSNALIVSYQRLRAGLVVTLLVILFGPIAWKTFCYFVWAPWVQKSPRVAADGAAVHPTVLAHGPSISVELSPGETLLVRPSSAHASSERLGRSHRWLLDWRHPFASLSARLYGLYGYSCASVIEGGRPAVQVTPPAAIEPADCVLVDVPEGEWVSLRPAALLGIVLPTGASPRVRARWRLGSRVAWLSGRLRSLHYGGPCRLVLSGGRGVHGQVTDGFGTRVRPGSVLAYSSGLCWSCIRAETFWGYAWFGEPLFDEVYRGRGWILVQDGVGEAAPAQRWWNGVADGAFRLLGY